MNGSTGEGSEGRPIRERYDGRGEYLRIIAVIILGMVVKGVDLERDDLRGLGYRQKPVYRAFRALRRAGVIRRITKKNYDLRNRVMDAARKFAEEDISHPVGWPNIHTFLFLAYGMFDWDEKKMDGFLSLLKKDWSIRVRRKGAGHPRAGEGAAGAEDDGSRTYSLKEASMMLGVTVRTIQRWNGQGKIRCVSLPTGGRRRVPEREIRRILGSKEPDV